MEKLEKELENYQHIAEDKAERELSGLRSKASKKIRDVEKRLSNVKEDAEHFEEIITPDSSAMDKYSQKIFEKVTETMKIISIPEKISLKKLNNFVETTRNALIEQDKTLIKYVKLLKDNKYKGRVKSLDRSLKRLNKDLENLEKYVKTKYEPSAAIEYNANLIEDTINLLDKYEEKYKDLMQREDEVLEKDKEVQELKKEKDSLKNHQVRSDYQKAVEEFESIQRDIDHAFSNIRKVFRKYDKYISKNGGSTNTQLLSNLVTDAATTLASQPSVTGVETLLKEVKGVLEDTALNLNKDKRETAKEDIESFLNGRLNDLYSKSTKIYKYKESKAQELEELKLDQRMEEISNSLAAAVRDRNRLFLREYRAIEEVTEEIKKNITEIETKLSSMVGKEVDIPLVLPDLPEWVDSD